MTTVMTTTITLLFSRILVAVDSSYYAMKTFEYTIQLSLMLSAKVLVIHVIQIPLMTDALVPISELETSFKNEGNELLILLFGTAKAKFGITVETIRRREYSKGCFGYGKKIKADLIVIASRGLSKVEKLLLGNVSHSIIKRANTPILVVK